MSKDIYELHDGIPIWAHLINNGSEHTTHIKGEEYGKMAEWIGKRELRNLINNEHLLDKMLPDTAIISIKRRTKRSNRSLEYGDYCLEISYEHPIFSACDKRRYGKKIVIIEIKHGKVQISQQQIQRYAKYIFNPEAYFRKADEVIIMFMLFNKIDTLHANAKYFFCEFNKNLAGKIINSHSFLTSSLCCRWAAQKSFFIQGVLKTVERHPAS